MKTKPVIAIIDYGVGNLRSLIRAFEHFGVDVTITEDTDKVKSSDAIVLPGDGAFAAGMKGLAIRNLTVPVKQFVKDGKPVLGICLGAQILLSVGYEFGKFAGLDLIGGKVVKFPKLEGSEKIPQIGWNSLKKPADVNWRKTILDKVKTGSNVYFIHSFIMETEDKQNILAYSAYGDCEFASVIHKNSIWGCQFHPEKSGQVGLKIINNFIKIVSAKIK